MSPQQQIESPAIVLDCRDHGESDKIITLFCQRLGRITGIAKGAKRSKKRFVNKLEIFSSLNICHTLPLNGRLAFIAEAELLDGFINIRTDIACYTTASIIREFLLLATKEMEGDTKLYPLLIWAFHSLNTQQSPNPVLIFFLIRFFSIIGYHPNLSNCAECGQQLNNSDNYSFHTQSGGIHCNRCTQGQRHSRVPLSCGTLKYLDMAIKQPLSRLRRLQLTEQSQLESLSFLHIYGRQLFQREIISWRFLNTETGANRK